MQRRGNQNSPGGNNTSRGRRRRAAKEPPPYTRQTQATEGTIGKHQWRTTLQRRNSNMDMRTTRKQYDAKEARGEAVHVEAHTRENRRRRLQQEKPAIKGNAHQNTDAARIRILLQYGNERRGILEKPTQNSPEQEQTQPTPRRNSRAPRITSEQDATKATKQQQNPTEAAQDKETEKQQERNRPTQRLRPNRRRRQKKEENKEEEENAAGESKQELQKQKQKGQQERRKATDKRQTHKTDPHQ